MTDRKRNIYWGDLDWMQPTTLDDVLGMAEQLVAMNQGLDACCPNPYPDESDGCAYGHVPKKPRPKGRK